MSKSFSRYVIEAAIVIGVFCAGLAYYGEFYVKNEKKFIFYQSYFFSSVNIYCHKGPHLRQYYPPDPIINDRIDLSKVACGEIDKWPKANQSYYNGWHDTHPIFSTLIGYTWRWLGLTWEALWPIAGALASLTLVSFYLIMRCFGLPWYAAILLLPAIVPFGMLERGLYGLRDFSKVPFILLSFALLGILFRSELSFRLRLLVLATSTSIIAIGMGFRQDAVVLMPAILAAAALTSFKRKHDTLRFTLDLVVIVLSFFTVSSGIDFLKTDQIAQLQGYPHFVVQGFADPFWAAARADIAGLSFMGLYSDGLAYAVVDANSLEKVPYFTDLDPKYTSSGVDLIVKYASLSAADMITRVFQGLSAVSHNAWFVKQIGIWLALFIALIALGRWRLSFFLMFAVVSLAAAATLQFDPRHALHLLMMDRAVLVVVSASLVTALWRGAIYGSEMDLSLAIVSVLSGVVLLVAVVVGAQFIQEASLHRLKEKLEAIPWFPSQEAYATRFPGYPEAILRFTIDENKCSTNRPEATIEVEGQKLTRRLDLMDGSPRSVYFAVFDPTIVKLSVDIVPRDCVTERSWGPLGDGSVPPLQFFDPEAALRNQTLVRHIKNLVSSLL